MWTAKPARELKAAARTGTLCTVRSCAGASNVQASRHRAAQKWPTNSLVKSPYPSSLGPGPPRPR